MNVRAALIVLALIGVPMFLFFALEFIRYERRMRKLGIPPERW